MKSKIDVAGDGSTEVASLLPATAEVPSIPIPVGAHAATSGDKEKVPAKRGLGKEGTQNILTDGSDIPRPGSAHAVPLPPLRGLEKNRNRAGNRQEITNKSNESEWVQASTSTQPVLRGIGKNRAPNADNRAIEPAQASTNQTLRGLRKNRERNTNDGDAVVYNDEMDEEPALVAIDAGTTDYLWPVRGNISR